ncbi:MAG: DUF2493 domain-containing protein [Myxococcales bacterium]|nr:DUF2493 domain-containing protein [Myxococcales bacterium]
MKLAVVGSRTFCNRALLFERLAAYLEAHPVTSIVSGGAAGADALAEEVAREFGLPCTVVRAEWDQFGRAAGPLRNARIAGMADAVLAFIDKPLAESAGTRDTVRRFLKVGKPVEVVAAVQDKA